MTFDKIKKAIGRELKLYNVSTATWLTGRGVTEDDIGEIVNELYRDDLFPFFAAQWPSLYRQTAKTDSWIATGTVSASSTGTTLVATTSIFFNSFVGLYVVNSTDGSTAKITEYTSATTVELDTTIGDTWDGDTIYVIGQEFSFGNDADDLYTLESIGIKYSSADTVYIKVSDLRPKPDIFQTGFEQYSKLYPQAYLTEVNVSGTLTKGIGILPQLDVVLENAISIDYVGKPPLLTTNVSPNLPVDLPLIYGGVSRAARMDGQTQKADEYLTLYEREKSKALARYRPTSSGTPILNKIPRRVAAMHQRRF